MLSHASVSLDDAQRRDTNSARREREEERRSPLYKDWETVRSMKRSILIEI